MIHERLPQSHSCSLIYVRSFIFTLRNGRPAVDNNSRQCISLRIFRDAFARGSSRIVHWALLDGQRFVVKKYMGISQDCLLQVMKQVFTLGT